jgi:hypothetical protein
VKLLACVVGASILLNVFVLWRLNEPSRISATTFYARTATPQATNTSVSVEAPQKNEIVPLQMQMAELDARLKAMEERYEASDVESEKSSDIPGQYSGAKDVIESFSHTRRSAADEEWFWVKDGEKEASLSFSQTDSFAVHSVVCRSDWCRVELENTSGEGEDLISDLELQLEINDSLGRDTVIRSGERNGSHRVLFVQ